MTKRNTKKALVVSLLSLLLCCSMLVGTTFAWFTDSVQTGNNKIVAGNLDVGLQYWNGTAWTDVTENTNVFEENTLWEPGHTEVVYLKVSNLGTLALDYKLGVNIAHETGSTNVDGAQFMLSDYIQVGVIKGLDETKRFADRDDARAAQFEQDKLIKEGYATTGTLYPAGNIPTDGVKEEYVAFVVYMPETVGNEANYKTGYAAPQILLGINLYATQETYEEDSFNEEYDEDATLPLIGTGAAPVEKGATYTTLEARDQNDGSKPKLATLTVYPDSIADDAESLTVAVEKTALNQGIQVNTDQDAVTFDVTVTGLKPNNTTPVDVILHIGTGRTGIKLYHYDVEITDFYYYDSLGHLTFSTTSFSPFSVVYDTVPQPDDTEMDESEPQAELRELSATDLDAVNNSEAWTYINVEGSPNVNQGQTLAVAYEFKAPHDAKNIATCAYKDWICDFYVQVELANGEKMELPAGVLFLGGYYDGFGWVGFNNPGVSTNEYIPLLQSVGLGWTYEQIAVQVGTFQCGVNRAVGNDSSILNGATFTVQLRLEDPTGAVEDIIVSTVEYKFN